MDSPSYLTTPELAQLLRRSVVSLEQDRARGRGAPYVRVGRKILYRRADVDRWLALATVVPSAP